MTYQPKTTDFQHFLSDRLVKSNRDTVKTCREFRSPKSEEGTNCLKLLKLYNRRPDMTGIRKDNQMNLYTIYNIQEVKENRELELPD